MAKAHVHAASSARKWGGGAEEYMHLHVTMDSSKAAHASVRHRAVFHSAFGVQLLAQIYGETFVNSAGRTVSVRDVAEQHIIEDLGFIPSLDDWLDGMRLEGWMAGAYKGRVLRVADRSDRERVARRLLNAAKRQAGLPAGGEDPGPIFGRDPD